MGEPEVNREYLLVRRVDAAIEAYRFVRWDDGSASFAPIGWIPGIFEGSPDAWRKATRFGLVQVEDAVRDGLLTKEEATELISRCSRPTGPTAER
jgi:hypothetical protein